MTVAPPWEVGLQEAFVGWLLLASAPSESDVEAASHFLGGLTRAPDTLRLLRTLGLVRHDEARLVRWAGELLPDLVRRLPTSSHREREAVRAGWRGRLDVSATLRQRISGDLETTIVRRPHRHLDLPQNVVLRTVAQRWLDVLGRLRKGEFLDAAWAAPLSDAENALHQAVFRSRLEEVSPVHDLTPHHLEAARFGRHPAYTEAALLWQGLRQLEGPPRASDAELVAKGALWPLDADKRFELAVLIRLLRALEGRTVECAPSRWTVKRAPARGDDALASYVRDDGARIEVRLDRGLLRAPHWEELAGHYVTSGRPRPDLTVTFVRADTTAASFVVEVKLTDRPDYMRTGFKEAWFYATELEGLLPRHRAILVASDGAFGSPRLGDMVIAQRWDAWPWLPMLDEAIGWLG